MRQRWRNVFVVAVGLTLVLAACSSEPDRDESGNITEEGDLDAFSIEVGDCVNPPEDDLVIEVPAVPCVEPHDSEAYALFDVTLDSFDAAAIDTEATEGCLARFEEYVGTSFEASSLTYTYLFPSEETFDTGDREVVCFATDFEGNKLEGTVKGSGL